MEESKEKDPWSPGQLRVEDGSICKRVSWSHLKSLVTL